MGLTTFISETFGNILFSDNSTARLTGSGNTGSINANSFLIVSATDCKLHISDSTEVKVDAVKSDITVTSCPNVLIKGNANKINVERSKGVMFAGDGNSLDAYRNSSIKFTVNGSTLKVFNSKDIDVKMKKGAVTADKNAYLLVRGEGGNVNVKGSINHRIEQSTSNENKLQVGLRPTSISNQSKDCRLMSGILSAWKSNNVIVNPNVTVGLTYVKNVTVDHHNYKLDNFNFTIEPESEVKYNVTLKETGLDSGSLSVKTVSPTEVQVSGTKDGAKQVLKVSSPVAVSKKKESDKVITIELEKSTEQKAA